MSTRTIDEKRRAALLNGLAHFFSSEDFFKSMIPSVIYTEGVRYLGKEGGAYWLIDAIVSHQSEARKNPRLADFQVWLLKVSHEGKAVLSCHKDLPGPAKIAQEIDFTDFPLDEIKLYVARSDEHQWTIMLPSEN